MTVVTTADTSQLYALAARHGLKLHGPLTVNELGLDYRIVIATVDDGRRWVLRIPRRAEVSAKVEPEARVLAMLKNRLPFAVPDWRVANAELVAYPMLEDSTAMVIQLVRPRPTGSCRRTRRSSRRASRPRSPPCMPSPFPPPWMRGCSSVHRRRPVRRWPTTLTASDASSW
nr:hypothetical protein BNIPNGOD_00036 [Salmonella enterica subsp. enterica serovar Typhimurium]